jgi:hypothetical protein
MWMYRNNGTCALWMSSLLRTHLDLTRRGHNKIPEFDLLSTCPKSRIQSIKCDLQCSAPIPALTHSWQAVTECSSHTNARNQTGHYLQKNEPASISEADYWPPTGGKIRKSYYNVTENYEHQPGTTLNHRRGPASCFPLFASTLPYREIVTLKSHLMTTLDQSTCAQSATHSYITLCILRPCVH